MSDTSRCTGHCCRRFPLSVSIQDLKDSLARGVRGERRGHNGAEAAFVLDMLIPLDTDPLNHQQGQPRQYYTCRHLQASGDCGAYDRRPNLCRDYPFYGHGGSCVNPDCTWEDGRNPPVPVKNLTRGLPPKYAAVSEPEEPKEKP